MDTSSRPLQPQEKRLFTSVCRASRTINSTLEGREILEALLDIAIEVTDAERGAILFHELPGEGLPPFRVGREIGAHTLQAEEFQVSLSVIRRVLDTRAPVVTDDAAREFQASRSLRLAGVRSILCVPLNNAGGEALGVAYLDSRVSRVMFDEEDLQLFSALADQAAVALENARLFHLADRNFLGAVRCLARSIGYKDQYTLEHSERVSRYSVMIAKALGFSRDRIREVEIAALLHDVGKIGVEEAILRKTGPLDPGERREMEEHPAMGFDIFSALDLSSEIKLGILHHQERYDGSGYPARLAGEEIPLIARVIAVADAWDAMTNDRAYRKALSREAALAELRKHRGTQFDPGIADLFLDLLSREESRP